MGLGLAGIDVEALAQPHNYLHHTYTNIVGKDRDLGYGVLRMSEEQPWRPYYLGNPIYATALALLFQYGVALHDIETERLFAGEREFDEDLQEIGMVEITPDVPLGVGPTPRRLGTSRGG